MAFIKQEDDKILIVQGRRNRGGGEMEKTTLFTIRSKAEARLFLDEGTSEVGSLYQRKLRERFPWARFEWTRLLGKIDDGLDALPESADYENERLRRGLMSGIVNLARELLTTDPEALRTSHQALSACREELEFVRELINARLSALDEEPSGRPFWPDPFFWEFATRECEPPQWLVERLEHLRRDGEQDRAATLWKLVLECFPSFAEGYNQFGLIAYERGDYETAKAHFHKAMNTIKRDYPRDIYHEHASCDSRLDPYFEGMANLILALTRLGQFAEALELTDLLESKHGYAREACEYRARILLNRGPNPDVLTCVERTRKWDRVESFIAALAALELGRDDESVAHYLYATLYYPVTARMLAGYNVEEPTAARATEDYDKGKRLKNELFLFFDRYGEESQRVFRKALNDEVVQDFLRSKSALEAQCDHFPAPSEKRSECFDQFRSFTSWEHVRATAKLVQV